MDSKRVYEVLTNCDDEIPVLELRSANDELPSLGHEDIGWSEDGDFDENKVALHARLLVGGDQLMLLCPHISEPFNWNVEIARAVAAAGKLLRPRETHPQEL